MYASRLALSFNALRLPEYERPYMGRFFVIFAEGVRAISRALKGLGPYQIDAVSYQSIAEESVSLLAG